LTNLTNNPVKKVNKIIPKYKEGESSEEDDDSAEESDADDADWIEADEEEELMSEEEEEEEHSADEDDILSEGEEDFIVKGGKKINDQAFQNLLSELFPSKYINNKLEKIKPAGPAQSLSPRDCCTPVRPPRVFKPVAPARSKIPRALQPSDLMPRGLGPRELMPRAFNKKNYKVEEEDKPSSPSKMANFNIIFTINPMNASKDKAIEDYEEYHSSDDPDYEPGEEEYSSEEDDVGETDAEEEEDAEEDQDAEEDASEAEEDQDAEEDQEEDQDASEAEEDQEDADQEDADQNEEADIDMDIDTSGLGDDMYSGNVKVTRTKGLGSSHSPSHKRNAVKHQARLCKKRKFKNTLKFRTLLQQKNVMNDLNYFQEKMSLEEQETVLKQMAEIKALIDIEKPYRLALLEANIPPRFKACAYNKLSTLKNMEPGCSEYNKIKHWVDDFMRIPFNKLNHLPVTIDDGIDKCHAFMEQAKNTLDKAVYGLDDVKLQVMQMVGQWITNPDAIGNAVAIEGPPGTGKTTLVKEGISKILNREFVFIPLGGATDSSCLEGHSYTYEGSNCGLIVKQLIQCQSMNPIIYFDELDKISDTPKGDEIVGILTHLTDTSQNSSFHDKYFAEFDFDLSRCVFFFSYNDRSKVNKILLDRMHCIMTKGYELNQKTIISTDYLLPVIREQVRFKLGDIMLPEVTLHHIINTHTHKEDGVRNLKRCLEIIHTKLNLYRLMRPDTNLFEKDMAFKVEFPITITPQLVDKLIKKQSETGAWQNMYI
jgi:ATP-dependent Lon protease